MAEKTKLSVVIPCYNEERRIRKCLVRLVRFFESNNHFFDWQIVVVNDGSRDKTSEIIEKFALKIDEIYPVEYEENAGKGYAVRLGCMNAKHNNILVLDTDLSIRPEEILTTMDRFDLNDDRLFVVAGQRKFVKKQTILRQFLGWGWRQLIWLMFFLKKDTQAPFKLFHNLPKEFFIFLEIEGFAYDVEILVKAITEPIPVYWQEVKYYNDEDSRVTFKKTLLMAKELLRIRGQYR